MINIINNEATGDQQPTHTGGGESARIQESLDHQRKEEEEEEERYEKRRVGSNLPNLILSGLM